MNEIDCTHWLEVTDMNTIGSLQFKHLPCIFPMQYIMSGEHRGQTTAYATKRSMEIRRKPESKWTAEDRAFKAQIAAELKALHDLEDMIKYGDKKPYLTNGQNTVLDLMMKQGASIHALAEQQSDFYRRNGFEIAGIPDTDQLDA